MKIFTKFALIGVLLVVLLMLSCDEGNDGESNLGDLTEVAFAEEETVKDEIVTEETASIKTDLLKFYGRWETEGQNATDKIILEMSIEDSLEINNSEEKFEFIRFGYEASGFFPREKIIEIEEHGSKNAYYITIAYVEENNDNDGWTVVETEETTKYLIELIEDNQMLLTYTSDEIDREFYFHKK